MRWKAERQGEREIVRLYHGDEYVGFVERNRGALDPAHAILWAAYVFVGHSPHPLGIRCRRCWAKRLVEAAR